MIGLKTISNKNKILYFMVSDLKELSKKMLKDISFKEKSTENLNTLAKFDQTKS